MLLSSILVQLAEAAIKDQSFDGSMPGGHNGPWNHADTRVRTTAHWAIAFNKAFEITGDKKWKVACLKCGDYLISPAARPLNASFYCRVDHQNPARRNNGLIGQAWVIEALAELGRKHEREEYLRVATQVIDLHRYSYKRHGWNNVLVDGREGAFDRTVNQQIWFSYIASRLSDYSPEAGKASLDFFAHLAQYVVYRRSGTICHVAEQTQWNLSLLKQTMSRFLFDVDCQEKADLLALGYQSFILVAVLSYLRETGTKLQQFPCLDRALRFSLDQAHSPLYEENPYCYGYNVTGIELAFVAESLGDNEAASWWLHQQFWHTRNGDGRLLSKNVSDNVLVPSRIYEIYRLKNDYEIGV